MISQESDNFVPARERAHEFAPQYAVCIHSNGSDVLATAHEPKSDGTLGVGKIVSMDDISRTIQTLNQKDERAMPSLSWVRPNVLLDTPEFLVWSIAPQKKTLWFRVTETESIDVLIPRTVFFVDRRNHSMSVFSAQAKKITPDTQLYHAPYMNVGSDGRLCQGNAKLPDDLSVTSDNVLTGCEDSLFDSLFTHTNHNDTWKRKNGVSNSEHIALWKKIAKQGRAPRMNELNRFGCTLRQMIEKTQRGSRYAL